MRPALHRAVLRRLALRAAVLLACLAAAAAVLLPAGFGLAAGAEARLFAFGLAACVAGAVSLAAVLRRPRPRATAPRALSRA